MLVHFWGVRGSIPSPLTADQVQEKIIAAINLMTPEDARSEESRKAFISKLPENIFGTVGGNTACVEVGTVSESAFLIDCGSGIRVYANNGAQPANNHYNIFLSHFHWDHIQGLPFFGPSFNPASKIDIYTAFPAAERILAEQSRRPYFPKNGCWDSVKKQITFHIIKQDEPFEVEGVKVTAHKMNHPGKSYSWRFEEKGKSLIYASDTEILASDFDKKIARNQFFADSDMLILDTQYTAVEAIQKANWGHNSFATAVDFADNWKARNLYFFHHEPTYSDEKIYKTLKDARCYAEYKNDCNLNIYLAVEGQEVEL